MRPWLWLGLGALALLVLGGGGVVIYNETRGLRNNNPGNIRKSSIPWRGKVAGNDPDFETFATMQDGVRALAMDITTKIREGFNTVRTMLSRYAPITENNTEAYIADVAARVGVGPDQPLTAANVPALVDAIASHENGALAWSTIPRSVVVAGLNAAGITTAYA